MAIVAAGGGGALVKLLAELHEYRDTVIEVAGRLCRIEPGAIAMVAAGGVPELLRIAASSTQPLEIKSAVRYVECCGTAVLAACKGFVTGPA